MAEVERRVHGLGASLYTLEKEKRALNSEWDREFLPDPPDQLPGTPDHRWNDPFDSRGVVIYI